MEQTATPSATAAPDRTPALDGNEPTRRGRRRPMRRGTKIAVFGLGLVLMALSGVATLVYALAPGPGNLDYTWSIGDRYGMDRDGDGTVDANDGVKDLAGDKAYVQDPTYTLTFDTCASKAVTERGSTITNFKLTLTGPEAKTVDSGACKITTTVKKLGTFTAKVEIFVGPVSVDSKTQTITPKDALVVSVGDSVASGEGNPDTLEGVTTWVPKWENEQCHRTSLAGPAQAALRMEKRDPHTAVTFVHVACSGASITKGLLGDYEGQIPSKGKVLKPQLDQVYELVGPRPIDALTVSIGANDAEFSAVVKACLVQTDCHTNTVPGMDNAKVLFDTKAPEITKNYALLDARLDKMAKQQAGDAKLAGKVFVTEYMDVTKDDAGGYCSGLTKKEIEASKLPGGEATDGLKAGEMAWADTYVQDGLNARVTQGITKANENGGAQIQFVGGIKAEFATHGYCAQDRWIRTIAETFLYQRGIDGAFHPNAEGHLFGYAKHLEQAVVPALQIGGTTAPLEFDAAGPLGDSLGGWIATLDKTNALDALTTALPLGSRDKAQTSIRDGFFGKVLPKIQQALIDADGSVTELAEKLDDLDGDGKPGVDAFGIANVTLDVSGDIQPKLPSKVYDISLTIKGGLALDPKLALAAGDVGIESSTDGKASFETTIKMHVDFRGKDPKKPAVTIDLPGTGNGAPPMTRIAMGVAADFGGKDGAPNGKDYPALSFSKGGLGLVATGRAAADVAFEVGLQDPNGDGVLDEAERKDLLKLVSARCAGGKVDLDLTAKASLVGFTTKAGTVTMKDANVCDGFSPPTVNLDDFGTFEGVTMVEFVNGLAQLSASLRSIQQSADIDIPFVKEGLADVVNASDRLTKFFVDNGLTDPNNPMANITYDPAKQPDLDTIDEILPKLAAALGVPIDKLNPRVVDQRLLLDLSVAYAPGPKTTGTLDFGDQLSRTGLAEVTGTAKATIDATLDVKLGLGIDLRKGLAFPDRFFVQLDSTRPELTATAKVTANAELKARLAMLDVTLGTGGPITLLETKTAGTPTLSINLDGKGDDRLTLAELGAPSTTAQSPIKPTLNAKVPAFALSAKAKIGDQELAAGKVNITWPDLTVPSGLSVTVDGDFTNFLLPFAYNPDNPRQTITQLLTATHAGVQNLRSVLASNADLVKALPFAGRNAAEIDPLLAKLESKLAELITLDENLTIDQAEKRIEKVIGEALTIAEANRGGLLTVRYQPRSGTTRAALVADVKLGVCSADRASAACTKQLPALSVPLNVKFGAGDGALAAVSSAGTASVSYDARLDLTVGVELPDVSLATAPGSFPSTTSLPKPFVLDTSSFELGIGAKVGGTFNAILGPAEVTIGRTSASGKDANVSLAARIALRSSTAVPATPKRVYLDSMSSWLSSLAPKAVAGSVRDTTSTKTTCTPAADACATLPVTLNNVYLGDLGFTAPDLLVPSGWTFDTAAVVAKLKTDSVQYALIVNGLETLAQRLETTLRNMPKGSTIPLLGADPTAGADVVQKFREGVLVPMGDITSQMANANNAKLVRDKVQDGLFAVLGPAGTVPLLRDGGDADTTITKTDIEVVLLCKDGTGSKACGDGSAATDILDLQVKLPLGKAATVTSKPFDSGFPGLRLSSVDGFSAGVGFEMDVAFGVDRTNGFYIPVNAFGGAPEVRVQATASLPSRMDAQIAFIPATITDLTTTPEVVAQVGVDLDGGVGGKLTAAQLGTLKIDPKLSACANVQLGLATGADKKFPAIKADLKMTGGLSCLAGGDTGAPAATSFAISFDNVRVNAGSFISDLLGPAAKNIRKYTGPLEPTIDALRKPIPGVAEAARMAGKPAPTWMDLLDAVNKVRMAAGEGDQLAIIKKIIFVVDLVKKVDSTNGTGAMGDIPLGSFKLNTTTAADPAAAGDPTKALTGVDATNPSTSIINRLSEGAGATGASFTSTLQPTTPYNSLTFPAFEKPQQLFELLLGKDVPLVRFEMGGSFLHVPVGPFAFPVGPATVYFGGALDLSGHFAAGYDTYGIRQAYAKLTSDDPEDRKFAQVAAGLLGGLYLDDYDASGKDVPELLAQAEVVVGAGVGMPGFGIFAEGGVHAAASLDLKTTDGKLRPEQIVKQLRLNPNPVCMFDAQARIDAFVRLVLSTPLKDFKFPIADTVILDEPNLFDFCNTQQAEGVKLTGKRYGDGTLEVFTSPESDRIRVTQLEPAGTVEVSSALGVETFEGITQVFVDGAAGDDSIDVLNGTTPRKATIPAHLCGGPGKDRLTAETGPAKLYGDTGVALSVKDGDDTVSLTCTPAPGAAGGADTLQGGDDPDLLLGGSGDDTLLGKGGKDDLKGEAGGDALFPGAGDDTVDGGEGNDTVSYSDRTDAMTIDLRAGRSSGATGTTEKDTFAGAESIVGSPQNDAMIAGDASATLDGGWGDDTLTGGIGADLLVGSSGNDTLLGGDGADLLVGADGDDRLVGGEGPDIYQGNAGTDTADFSAEPGPVNVSINGQADDGRPDQDAKDNVLDADVVLGTTGDDVLSAGSIPAVLKGGAGADTLTGPGKLYGEAGKDVLQGSDSRDELYGGADEDRLMGNGADDLLDGGDQDDRLDGGLGPDDLWGGTGFDTIDYSSRTTKVTIYLPGGPYDGEGDVNRTTGPDCANARCDQVNTDLEQLIGGSGDDVFDGTTGDQVMIGNDGNDDLDGGGGIDRFEGGAGNDWAADNDFGTSTPDAAGKGDTYLMGAGNDTVSGSGGNEVVDTGEGDDHGSLGNGDVVLTLGPGKNSFVHADGKLTATSVDAEDTIDSGAGAKTFDLGAGDDTVILRKAGYSTSARLGAGDDEYDGSVTDGGKDVVDGGPGDDFLTGGVGDDTLTDLEGGNLVYAGPGNDRITTGPGVDEVRGDTGDDTIVDAGSDGIASRQTSQKEQYLWGEADHDTVTMTGSTAPGLRDHLNGDAGNDTVSGTDGFQVISGGAGNDTLDGRGGDDQVFDDQGGTNLVQGGTGDDWVSAGTGTNTIDGGPGADRIDGGDGIDTVDYSGRTGPVAVTLGSAGNTYDDGSAVDGSATTPGRRDSISGGIDHIIGTAFDDTIQTNDVANSQPAWIEGRGGRDTIVNVSTDPVRFEGGDGDDTLIGGTLVDTLTGGAGNDLLSGGLGADKETGGAGNDRFDQGPAVDGGDAISGGTEVDVVDYSGRPASPAISVTPGVGGANDGAPGEGDDVDATVETGRTPGSATPTPTVTVTMAKGTAAAGQTVNADVTVTGSAGAGRGSVVLSENGSRLAAAVLGTDGKASVPLRLLTPGTRTITATFQGDAAYRTATGTAQVVVSKVGATLTLAAVNSPTKVGSTTVLHAEVAVASGDLQPYGSLAVFEGSTKLQTFTLATGAGDVTLQTPLALGRHDLTATWTSDGSTEPATSSVVTVLVTADGKAPAPTVTVTTDPATPTGASAFTVRATVAAAPGAGAATGTVTFTAVGTAPVVPSTTLGTAPVVAGSASLALPAGLPGGTYAVTATYAPTTAGDAGAVGSKAVTVGKVATSTTLASNRNPATTEDGVTLTATVARSSGTGTPTGRVTFFEVDPALGEQPLGSAALGTDGRATLTRSLLVGTHPVKARFEGSDGLAPSTSSALSQVVTTPTGSTGTATTTTVTRSGNDVVATVAPAAATGSVQFFLDGTPLGTPVNLAAGTARTALPVLTTGTHSVLASYGGSTTHRSSSGTLSITVDKVGTSTTLARVGTDLVATVSPAPAAASAGAVQFTLDGTPLGTPVSVTGGKATLALPTLSVGTHTATAAFGGSATHGSSTSAVLTITVTAGATPSAPGTPTVTKATGTSATIGWKAPTAPGGSAVSSYRVSVLGATGTTVLTSFDTGSAALSSTVTGLVPGTPYRFTVAATNGSGTGPASAASAHAVPPFTSIDAFTTRQYADAALRVPTAAELASWRTRLANGSATPAVLADEAIASANAEGRIAPVVRLFSAFFQRLPDKGGLDYWVTKYRNGTGLNTIAATFAGSSEFKNKYGSLTNKAFVELIYTNVLKRTPDAAGVSYWTKKLDKGTSRGVVMTNFSESSENKRVTKPLTDVVVPFRVLLQRVPTAAELAEWQPKLASGTPRSALVAVLLATAEYDARV